VPQYQPRLNQQKQDLKLIAHIHAARNDNERLQILKQFFHDLKN
jgi:hypothetical protein